jgi:acrylyl-CoA reductase (NADPH)
MFNALVLNKIEDQKATGEIKEINISDLPEGDVLVKIDYSTINYKDSLAITSSSPIIKNFPMVPGIDFSGTVEESSNNNFTTGDKVILNGFGVGEKYWGGLSQKARVNGNFLVKLPKEFTTKQAMAIGTAGYTAMLCVLALEKNGVTPEKGDILVTGATGGVGSVAISILAKLGYQITASSGRAVHSEYLKSLGAEKVIDRNELSEKGDILVTGATGGVGSVAISILAKLGYQVTASSGRAVHSEYLKSLGAEKVIDRNELSEKGRPLSKEIWAGAIDSVGSYTLANICASIKYGGTVAACGLAQGFDLPTTVMPFILRNVTLAGVDSVYCPVEERIVAWDRLVQDLNLEHLDSMISTITLSEVVSTASDMLSGKTHGRIIVDVNA